MKIFRVFSRRTKYILSAATLVVTFIAPTLFTGFASAAVLTSRSIEMSSSAQGATGVSYTLTFTPATNAAAYVLDFCSNSPTVGDTCDAPTSMNTSAAASTSSGVTNVSPVGSSTSTIAVTQPLTASTPVTDVITGITNPTLATAGTFYARIVTYTTAADAQDYTDTTAMTVDSNDAKDQGGVALSTTSDLNVSGEVTESLTFCQSNDAYTAGTAGANCGGATPLQPVHLGTSDTHGNYILGTSLSSSTIYTQISTNAVNGAVVRLKSDATGCGGLYNSSTPNDSAHCYITPALTGGINNGDAKFGVLLGTEVNNSAGTTHGTVEAANGSGYNSSTYALNFTSGASPASGVTSVYGDPILDTNSAPADSQSMPITFGAQINNETPAGNYSANLSLIATGTF